MGQEPLAGALGGSFYQKEGSRRHAMISEGAKWRRCWFLMTEIPACKHEHTRLIAKDNEAEYIECVDCGVILETRELAEAPKNPTEPAKPNPFDESLSDA